MTKRELIDKKSIMGILNSIDYDTDYECDYIFHTCDYDEVLEKVEYADGITEEEIVKPYLEKLSKEISEAYEDDEYDGYDPNALGRFEERVQELIDNLLAEKGAEE